MELTISKPLTLKCGLTLPNRLVKAVMAERLADRKSLPTSEALLKAHSNIDVDPEYIGTEGDVVVDASLPRGKILEAWKTWAQQSSQHGTLTLVQLNHPGRQTQMKRGMAPSAIPMDFGPGLSARLLNAIVFGTPREMTTKDIKSTIKKFSDAASLAAEAGFAGVELHGAHGYLLAQFLSPLSNQRTDEYGGSALARAKFVVDVITAVRTVVPSTFCVSIKLNSVDHQSAGDMDDCIAQLRAIVDPGIDLLEISGGTFEKPLMHMDGQSVPVRASTKAREAYFLDFASAIRSHFPDVPLMVTGGFRTRKGMEAAVAEGHCDLVGIAQAAGLHPRLPKDIILNPGLAEDEAVAPIVKVKEPVLGRLIGVKAVGAGAESRWYADRIREIGEYGRAKR